MHEKNDGKGCGFWLLIMIAVLALFMGGCNLIMSGSQLEAPEPEPTPEEIVLPSINVDPEELGRKTARTYNKLKENAEDFREGFKEGLAETEKETP